MVDVLPIQLDNLARKLPRRSAVDLLHGDSAALDLPDASYDRALLFFLLHEQPEDVRRATLAEALRMVKPGGAHRDRRLPPAPARCNPLFLPMAGVLSTLEPFAMDLWRTRSASGFRPTCSVVVLSRRRPLSAACTKLIADHRLTEGR